MRTPKRLILELNSLGKVGWGNGGRGHNIRQSHKTPNKYLSALPTPHCLGESQCVPSQSPLFLTFLTFIDIITHVKVPIIISFDSLNCILPRWPRNVNCLNFQLQFNAFIGAGTDHENVGTVLYLGPKCVPQ